MKCEDFLKQWQCGDTLTDDMNKHLLECKHCATKLKNYNDMLGYIKTNNYPTKVNVVSDVMQTIENSQNIEKPKPKKITFKQIATISLSVAATLALLLLVQKKVAYTNSVELQNEAIASMFDDVYGYNNQYLSYNELDAIEYFLENYEE
ncbi:MAG: hypothetical protein IKJ67_09590 [Bacteroidales bacterium]|nr:hypothetical protein [Bacteroidales bacterium]